MGPSLFRLGETVQVKSSLVLIDWDTATLHSEGEQLEQEEMIVAGMLVCRRACLIGPRFGSVWSSRELGKIGGPAGSPRPGNHWSFFGPSTLVLGSSQEGARALIYGCRITDYRLYGIFFLPPCDLPSYTCFFSNTWRAQTRGFCVFGFEKSAKSCICAIITGEGTYWTTQHSMNLVYGLHHSKSCIRES